MAQKIIIVVMLCLVILAGVLVLVLSHSSCPDSRTCIPIQDCYDRHKNTNSLNTSLLFSCSDRTGSVCCPEVTVTPFISHVDKKEVENLEAKRKLLPEDCGFTAGGRISVGQAAAIGQFPWMALLAFNINGSKTKTEFLCGGTLISPRYILTAAHCLYTMNGSPVSVRLGELDLTEDPDCDDYCADPVVDVEVEKVIPHMGYNQPYLKNDIALLRLGSPVLKSDTVRPICLPFGFNISGEEEGKKYRIAGWGKIEDASKVGSTDLLFATVDSVPVTECDEAQTLTPAVRPIANLQLCAGGVGGQDACKGDSGGPLMDSVLTEDGRSREFQVGIVSFGSIPCGAQIPSVYTRVPSYLNWILAQLEP